MQTPLNIAFHNTPADPGIEADIRERVDKLERLFDGLIGCRVAVEAQHQQHRTGNVYDVHIELVVPGGELVVSRQPKKAQQKYANPDVRTSIRDAFQAAERQLKDYKAQLRGDVKSHAVEVPGQIARLVPEEDHGFIMTGTGTLLYFHRNSVLDGDFDALSVGEPVNYVEDMGDTGPTAAKVFRRGPARQSGGAG
ncbi:HPF/RaiA family ribosome-associated protein [Arenibaculum pallidiluteum]|uniref:HPF/RaiA family ribosome-associated protein n=1 Tax=Arenibaculum pallidiluteum TaxID=2812559 RepID=UPI001A975336|nr:HPF/RaiA family ribosome-associated protein [Arenibaculum pallidiluteum]